MICELSNEFVRFCLYFEKNINFNQLQKFFGAYASIKKINYLSSEYDLFVSFVSPKSGAFSNSANLIDNHIMKHDKNALYVGIENYNLEEIVFKNSENQKIRKIIKKLKPEYQEIIYLTIFEGFKYKEVARIMDKSIAQVKGLLHRAKKKLKELLESEGYTYDV